MNKDLGMLHLPGVENPGREIAEATELAVTRGRGTFRPIAWKGGKELAAPADGAVRREA